MGKGPQGRRAALAVALALAGGLAGNLPGARADRPADAGPPEPKRFILTLRDSVADPAAVAAEHAAVHGAEVAFVYTAALKGYAATFRGGANSEVAATAGSPPSSPTARSGPSRPRPAPRGGSTASTNAPCR